MTTTMRTAFALIVLATLAVSTRSAPAQDTPELAPGWRWELEPRALPGSWRERGYTRLVPSGVLQVNGGPGDIVHLMHVNTQDVTAVGARAPEFEFHLLDAEGRPIRMGLGTMSNGRVAVRKGTLRGDPARDLARVGLAVLDYEGRRALAREAESAIASTGAASLPFPEIGKPYRFDLPTMDGGRVRSEDLRGKVVLVDCWATWCTPCMQKMPALKELAAEHGDDGFVVVGVTFDATTPPAQAAIDEHGLAWPHVHAASAAAGYDGELWHDLATISTLPRLFLIDRDGILRDDFYPHDVAAKVKPLLEEAGD